MKMFDYNKELDLISEYMNIYIQLLPNCTSCGGKNICKYQLPTFEYFKEKYNDKRYSLIVPNYKESKRVINNEICDIYTHGLGSYDGIAYRYYNYWKGCKYFVNGNIKGDYTIKIEELNRILKTV